jgi:elongation factor G
MRSRTSLRKIRNAPRPHLQELIDAVSNKDDEIANLVLEDKPITAPVLKAAIRRLTCKIELVPVLCGSAFKKKGVQVLVDAVIDYLPSPLDIPRPKAMNLAPTSSSKSRRRQ